MTRKSPDIIVRGARQNNLKNINAKISPGKLTVITGLSGTGKSTLLFDVLHAEGQRRYVETFSPYVRQFLDSLPKPHVEEIVNARPSIAVEQKNTVRNSRSTVGTMTELCDYFKVWFSMVASLIDPEDGKEIICLTPETQAKEISENYLGEKLLVGFNCTKPKTLSDDQFLSFLLQSGYDRKLKGNQLIRIKSEKDIRGEKNIFVVIDRVIPGTTSFSRLVNSISTALDSGKGFAMVKSAEGKIVKKLFLGLRSASNGQLHLPARPSLFSFNSAEGACSKCKGFGSVISIDPDKVIANGKLSLNEDAIKSFTGKVYGHCKVDLLNSCENLGIDPNKPLNKFSKQESTFLWEGDPSYETQGSGWYGINRFFKWLEKKTYKMHVRVFLAKYRNYFPCPECNGKRLSAEALNWKWGHYDLSELYSLSVNRLLDILPETNNGGNQIKDSALLAIRKRLTYLQDVGLGYLSLGRPSMTLSGGETQRVNLTACLGSALTDALFALDEPTIGLHGKDVGKLVGIMKKLARAGNCVCVVEHDDQVIRAADQVIEIGPKPGSSGGFITFSGTVKGLVASKSSCTGRYLREENTNNRSIKRGKARGEISISNANLHNLKNFSANLPMGRFSCIAGVSGSGKSTLVNEIIYNELSKSGFSEIVNANLPFEQIVLIDQKSISKTPRSNAIIFVDGWNPIKEALGRTDRAKKLGYCASDFSFNAGNGRCENCNGLGFEIVEMQFLSDIQIPCSFCAGMRFKDDLLTVNLCGFSVSDILKMSVNEAIINLANYPKTRKNLSLLQDVGLGYLPLGQPLNTLSGGESQRLKLVKYMGAIKNRQNPSILLVDEPTTGLHMSDIEQLLNVFDQVTSQGHTLLVIEHNAQVLRHSDWILELGPGAGTDGGKVVAQGTPKSFRRKKTHTSRFLFPSTVTKSDSERPKKDFEKKRNANKFLEINGARENNLKNINLKIPHQQFVVVTGPSGSGKSSLAFEVIFAEGQRRFMESMSSYARQFVHQMRKPEVDHIHGMPPTVAIRQRVVRGSKKSTVGSITEVAQYLRLLYAKIGTQLSFSSKKPLSQFSTTQIEETIRARLNTRKPKKRKTWSLLAPLISNRKGHHKPIINWAFEKGFREIRCDGMYYQTENFPGLDRYRQHDIEAVITHWDKIPTDKEIKDAVRYSLEIGNNRCLLFNKDSSEEIWLSTDRVDPETGISYPLLEPAHFSWNSVKGQCSFCKGYGRIFDWMKDDLPASDDWWCMKDGETCPKCQGHRLGSIGMNVILSDTWGNSYSLPELLSFAPDHILKFLSSLKISQSQSLIANSILPEIAERLNFMKQIGLSYLNLNRETSSLSGGESQRIRISGQLGSNLSGVLYVLDEPSIGLHPSDNQRLLDSLKSLRSKGNSLLVVEHDEETMNQADFLIDMGPEAGDGGGQIVSMGEMSNKVMEFSDAILLNSSESSQSLPSGLKNLRSLNWLRIRDACFRNIKQVSIDMPINRLNVICGVSGSGKSSLARGVLLDGVKNAIAKSSRKVQSEKGIIYNGNIFGKSIEVDQKPIGKTPRSTPATYLGIWDRIRTLFSQLQESKVKGLSSSSFSFNVKGGRCDQCKGNGNIKLEMTFLPDSYIDCSSCQGMRYKEEILEIKWNDKNIAQILDLTFKEAVHFFEFDYLLTSTFQMMVETGLGYLKLGQSSSTLSGGEAQRLKLVSEVATGIDKGKYSSRPNSKPNFYVLEEPTIGLHRKDRAKLLSLLRRLVNEGHTVVVIEHDTELISSADYVIEMGPKGGIQGGNKIFQGIPRDLITCPKSNTAPYLKKFLL
ncbi:MAG: excinuclease ABC subunit UvrA [Verrucomicrobiota bacterium]|nr:excinuclease ABC subunit UvrA [Verrucomicrobiota bacterium]